MNSLEITEEDMRKWLVKNKKFEKKERTMKEYPKRGDIWTLDFGIGVGSEIRGVRPVVVISSSLINERNHTLLVLPISKRSNSVPSEGPGFEYHLPITADLFEWGNDRVQGVIKTESIYTQSRGRIGKRIGRLNDTGIEKMTELVSKVLHIKEPISSAEEHAKRLNKKTP